MFLYICYILEFGYISEESVRIYWADEAREFTPWLADSIDAEDPSKVEDTIQLDLTLRGIEQSVGRYNLDISLRQRRSDSVYREPAQNVHNHLEKCLAYASGVDADVVVWICPEFTDEHSDAFQWLNDHSEEGIDLFALRLEVWRIGDSEPAVRFTAVEEPSEWKDQARRSSDLSDSQKLYQNFWTDFRDAIAASETPLRARKPKPHNWYNNPIGRSDMKIQFKASIRENKLASQLVIDDNPEAFEVLRDDAEAIQSQVQGDLEWHPVEEAPENSSRTRISVTRDADFELEDQWPGYQDWLLERGTELHDAVHHRVRDLNL